LATISAGSVLSLQNLNLDIGEPVRPGEYRLADEATQRLMEKARDRAKP
jgi:hypothetical protein